MLLAIFDNLLIHGRIGSVRYHRNRILKFIVDVPHFTAIPHYIGHRSVDNNVIGNVQVRNSVSGVDHRQFGTIFIHRRDVGFDLSFLIRIQLVEFIQNIRKTVIDIDDNPLERLGVLFEGFFVEHGNTMAEDDRIGYLHHRCLQMQ